MSNSPQGLITIAGPEAEKFLQGQLTCDVRQADAHPALLGAYCNPQGRVQATFRLSQHKGTYTLHLPLSMVQPTLTLLQKYALFSKVGLAAEHSVSPSHWELDTILKGIPIILPETIGLFTPHMLNYDTLGGISFDKGCYMGQEVVARTHYLGHAKQHTYRAQIASQCSPGDPITTILGESVGTVVNIAPDTTGKYYLLVVLKDAFFSEKMYVAKELLSICC
ncbi:MAG: YgfZ/GcvT domain-containing protein [Gammaproteobacteria bacterium]